MIDLLQNISFPKGFLNALAIFLAIYQSQGMHSRLALQKYEKTVFYHFLFFTTKSTGVPGTHFIDRGKMKDRVDLGASQWIGTRDPATGNPAL